MKLSKINGLKHAAVAAVVALSASVLLTRFSVEDAGARPSAAAVDPARPSAIHTSYANLLVGLDQRIVALQTRADRNSGDWLTRMSLGSALLERAGLTARADDLARVQQVLDESFAVAPEGSGPLALAARFNFTIHRLDRAESYLDRMERRPVQKRDQQLLARVLRAEIALQRGEYDVAFEGLSEAAEIMPAGASTELALYHARTGEPGIAEALLEEVLTMTSPDDPRRRAWTRVQLGMLASDHGDIDLASKRFQQADAELPGWWFVREHIAELHVARGDDAAAIAIYEELVRLHGLAQHMDPLAVRYEHTGRTKEARELAAKAGAIWDAEMARFPESAMGHAFGHVLRHGTAARALELAEANVAVRPGGDAQIILAKAYLQAGRPADALGVIQRAQATPYRAAALHDLAAKTYAALGQTAESDAQRELCLDMNPWYQDRGHTH